MGVQCRAKFVTMRGLDRPLRNLLQQQYVLAVMAGGAHQKEV